VKRYFSVYVMELVRPSRNREDVAVLGFGSPVIVNWSDVHDSGAPGPQPKARMKTTAVASATGASTAVLYRMPNCTALTRKGGDDTSSGEMPGGANGQWYIAINRQRWFANRCSGDPGSAARRFRA